LNESLCLAILIRSVHPISGRAPVIFKRATAIRQWKRGTEFKATIEPAMIRSRTPNVIHKWRDRMFLVRGESVRPFRLRDFFEGARTSKIMPDRETNASVDERAFSMRTTAFYANRRQGICEGYTSKQ
jgi:hypothetical protein